MEISTSLPPPLHTYYMLSRAEYLNADVQKWIDSYTAKHGDDSRFLPLIPPGLYVVLFKYVFPFQFFFGVVGNILNLLVLLSRNMKNEANILLSAMGICDIILLFTLLPSSMGAWPIFYMSDLFRKFLYSSHTYLLFLGNLLSCITTWLILAVSVERYLGIQDPLNVRCGKRRPPITSIIVAIVLGSTVITSFHVFEYKYGYGMIMNGTKLYGNPVNIKHLTDVPQWMKRAIKVFKILQMVIGLFIPTIGIMILNLKIIKLLRESEFIVTGSKENGADEQMSRKNSDNDTRQKRDQKVTITVLSIIGCFLITHVPSAVPFAFEILEYEPEFIKIYFIPLSTSWLITGKVSNLVLFCLSSIYFRRRLWAVLRGRCPICKYTKSLSGMSSAQSIKCHAYRLHRFLRASWQRTKIAKRKFQKIPQPQPRRHTTPNQHVDTNRVAGEQSACYAANISI